MGNVVISGTGLFTPAEAISNEELVESFNCYVRTYNEDHSAEIETGRLPLLQESSCEFIEKASGIKSRYVIDKKGILNPDRLCPSLPERSDDEPSIQCEIGAVAATEALQVANKNSQEIDAIIVACSNLQRPYPAVVVEDARQASSKDQFEILGTKLQTAYSNNIRNNFGFLKSG